uniref:Fibrinogen C-terminal domain-containing protein n=1 Tax=Melopsittacus undulatus TaxID=13146 RepID=A0A8C6IXD9_MELUD
MERSGLSVLLLLLLGITAAAAPAGAGPERRAAGKERRAQFASWDEVNVIAHGLLQLGHGLKEHVDRTKGQMRELGSRLSAHNSSLGRLLRQARDAQEQGERLRDSVRELEGRGRQLLNLSEALRQRLEEVAADKAEIQGRLEQIEGRLRLCPTRLHLAPASTAQSPRFPPSAQLGLGATLSSMALSFPAELPQDCHQLFLAGQQSSGVFQVQPAGSQPFKVYCDMTTEGGWTVIQRRTDGSVDFDQLWDAYKNGFGDLRGDFWLGLEKMHRLIQEGRFNLLIELEDWEGNSQVIQFVFSLGGESTAYTLSLLGPLSGELENAIGDFRQLPFSTRDRDHDLKADTNCAKHLSGGWWFSTCGHANLNGKYFRSIPRQRHERKQGIFWKTWKGRYYPLKSTTMKIQPAALEAEP